MGSNPATPDSRTHVPPRFLETPRSDQHCEEHRRDREPDPRPARHRGSVRRAEVQLGRRLQEDRRVHPHPRLPSRQGPDPDHRPARRAIIRARRGRERRIAQGVQRSGSRERHPRPRAARHRGHEPGRRGVAELHRRGRHPSRDRPAGSLDRGCLGRGRHGQRRRRRRAARCPARALRNAVRRPSGPCRPATTCRSTCGPRSTARWSTAARPAACRTRSGPRTSSTVWTRRSSASRPATPRHSAPPCTRAITPGPRRS